MKFLRRKGMKREAFSPTFLRQTLESTGYARERQTSQKYRRIERNEALKNSALGSSQKCIIFFQWFFGLTYQTLGNGVL